jgi:hypothetical protein
MLLDSDENEAELADAAETAETPAEDEAEGRDDDLDSWPHSGTKKTKTRALKKNKTFF